MVPGPMWAHLGNTRMKVHATRMNGPGPGWGPVRVGPLWARFCLTKLIILIKNDKIINKNIKVVKLEILKVKKWFGDKDYSS